jgi:hypothetical protein
LGAIVEYWHWLALGMVLIGMEIFVPSFTVLWFGVGALIVGTTLLIVPGMGSVWQFLLWSVASAVFTFAWFRFFRTRNPDRTKAGLSREMVLGETAQVIVAPAGEKRGMLRFATPKLGAEEWEFICETPVSVGDRVSVLDVSGNTLIVTRR